MRSKARCGAGRLMCTGTVNLGASGLALSLSAGLFIEAVLGKLNGLCMGLI